MDEFSVSRFEIGDTPYSSKKSNNTLKSNPFVLSPFAENF